MQAIDDRLFPIEALLERALQARRVWRENIFSNPQHESAFRLFNGFLEGCPDLAVDLYGSTMLLFNFADDLDQARLLSGRAVEYLLRQLPWVNSVVVKTRNSREVQQRRGVLVYGGAPCRKICEQGIFYAVDLTLNLDASLYLDTRNLRAWLAEHMAGKRVLNAFAYTGSLGIAALAGGARQVVQLDRNPRFLRLAQESCALNGFPIHSDDFIAADFWPQVGKMKRAGELFDCVIVDPPFFSQTRRGRVDLASNAQRVLNKVRPLVGHGGALVVVNNSLYLSGAEFLGQLEELCSSGYLAIEEQIPVPLDFTGFQETREGQLPQDPAPFNHSTKIVILRVQRKDRHTAADAHHAFTDPQAARDIARSLLA